MKPLSGLFFLVCVHLTLQQGPPNIDQWAKSRQKRFLIFSHTGLSKIILAFALPIDLKDKRSWRALAGAWNVQSQHNLPLTVLHYYNRTYFPVKERSFPKEPIDLSATFLYEVIVAYMNGRGMRGRECMQRSICENAQVHYVGGVMDQIYQRLLTPEQTMDDHYKDAYVMGSKGVDCYATFRCPQGESVFDQFVQISDVD